MKDSPPKGPDHLDSGSVQIGRLTRAPLVSLSIASFIPAVGIALAPMLIVSTAGVTAWPSALLAMLAMICVGRAVVAFARRFVATGSLYSYIGEVFGPWARYLMAATLFVGFVLQIAAITCIIGIFTGNSLTSLGVHGALDFAPQVAIFLAAIAISTIIALRGLDTSVTVAVTLAVLSLPLVLVVTGSSAISTGLDIAHQFDFASFSAGGTLQGLAAGATFLVGFESSTALAAESRDPRRNIPVAVMSVPIVLGAIYVVCVILQVPGLIAASDQLAAGISPPAALAMQSGLPAWVATATDLVLVFATFAALIGFTNYGARFAMTLGIDRLLPRRVGATHGVKAIPARGIVLLSALGFVTLSVLVLVAGGATTAYNAIAALIVYAWVGPYLLITAGAVVLSLRSRPSTLFLIATSAAGFAAMAWVYLNSWLNPSQSPVNAMSWVVLIVVATILVVFVLCRRADARRDVSIEAIGRDPTD